MPCETGSCHNLNTIRVRTPGLSELAAKAIVAEFATRCPVNQGEGLTLPVCLATRPVPADTPAPEVLASEFLEEISINNGVSSPNATSGIPVLLTGFKKKPELATTTSLGPSSRRQAGDHEYETLVDLVVLELTERGANTDTLPTLDFDGIIDLV